MIPGNVKSLIESAKLYEPKASQKALCCMPISEFMRRPPPAHSIKGVIPRRGLGVLFGETGSGKSFTVLDIGMHIAQGKTWRGRNVQRGGVVYISAEGASGLPIRLQAYLKHHNLDPSKVPLVIIPVNVNLLNPGEQLNELITEIKNAATQIGDVSLIIIDTLNRTMQGGDENKGDDMSAYLSNVSILADAIDAFALIVHHSGKDASRGARGHSSLKATVDMEIEVTKGSGGDRAITLSKSRDGEDGVQFGFRLEPVALGVDADGDPITSCVVTPTEVARHRNSKLTGVATTALTALQEAIGDHGELIPATSSIPSGIRAITIEQWRNQFKVRYGSNGDGEARDADTVKKAFTRGKEKLIEVHAAGISDKYAWLTQ